MSTADKVLVDADRGAVAAALAGSDRLFPQRIDADPEQLERGLAQLVLTVVEVLRQLMERQALRRVDVGDLSDEQVERLGLTLMRLEERMTELKELWGLTDDDLRLHLGPLGDLV